MLQREAASQASLSGGFNAPRQSRDLLDVGYRCVAASGLGEKIKCLVAVITDRHERLIHVIL